MPCWMMYLAGIRLIRWSSIFRHLIEQGLLRDEDDEALQRLLDLQDELKAGVLYPRHSSPGREHYPLQTRRGLH